MKTKLIFISCFSLFCLCFGQKADHMASRYRPNLMVGVDVLNAGVGFFSERQLYQGFVSSEVKRNIHAVADLGVERNRYNKNGYDAVAKGFFAKLGGFYMLVQDPDHRFNGFFVGGKLAASFFQ